MICIGKKPSFLLPQSRQAGHRRRKKVYPKYLLIDRDFELIESFPNRFGTYLQPPKPVVRVDLTKEIGGGTRDQTVSIDRVVEKPAGGNDVAPNNQRHSRVEGFQRDREPQVFG